MYVVAGIVVLLGWMFIKKEDPITNYPPKGDTVLVFGDSLVSGVGASEGKDFVSLLSRSLQKPVLNFGVPGDTTERGLVRINEAVKQKPDIVLILLGGNDALKKISKEETERNLMSIVHTFQAGGAVTVVIGVRGGLLGDPYDAMYKRVAKKTGSVLVEDVLDGLFGDMRYMSDVVHPNDAGYELISQRITSVVMQILKGR